jgi:hypothetical protein
MQFSQKLICLLVFLLLSQISYPVFSQARDGEIDKVEVTLFIVPETDTCAPKGSGDKGCPPLTREHINRWKEMGKNWKTFTLAKEGELPQPLSLGGRLFEILDVYASKSKANAKERLSVVLFFDWKEPKTFKVGLKRVVIKKIPFLSAEPTYPLENQGYWIYHERADAFLPSNNIKWTFMAGKQTWEFVLER